MRPRIGLPLRDSEKPSPSDVMHQWAVPIGSVTRLPADTVVWNAVPTDRGGCKT